MFSLWQSPARTHIAASATRSHLRTSLWHWYFIAGLTTSIGFLLLPPNLGQSSWFALWTWSTPLVLVLAVWMYRPVHRAPWLLMAGGLWCSFVADAIWVMYENILHVEDTFPSFADALYLGGYALLVWGLHALARRRARVDAVGSLLDALIITVGIGFVVWVWLMEPYTQDATLSSLERLVLLAYPFMDVLMLGVFTRLWLAGDARLRAFHWLGVGIVLLLATDITYLALELAGTNPIEDFLDVGYLVSNTFIGMAALHPSMRAIADAGSEPRTKITRRRLATLTTAALLTPATMAFQYSNGVPINIPTMIITSAVLIVLVLVRMGGLLHLLSMTLGNHEQSVMRERTLRAELETTNMRLRTELIDRARIEEALATAHDAALAASRLKSEFLATMSHEIRTPMNGVIGMTELLLTTSLTSEQHDYAAVVRRSGQTLLTLIDDILDFSKIEAGKLVLEKVTFDPRQLAYDVAAIVRIKAREKGIHLETHIAPDVPTQLHGDEHRVRQVLLNLVSNAVKFTAEGEVSLHIAVDTTNSIHATLCFSVVDTGIGIGAQAQTRLFQPFTQSDSSTTRCFGGTGLGLAISKQLVELMGGSIGVESVLGHGSTFWCTITFEYASTNPTAYAYHVPGPRNEGHHAVMPTPSNGVRVLLAEDNEVNRKLALAQLRKLGYEADAVANGTEAIAALAQGQFALILMDCQMPVTDGFMATRAIRQQEHGTGGRVPIIALTANAMNGDRDACLAAGMDDYLTKPVRLDDLRATLERWITRSNVSVDTIA